MTSRLSGKIAFVTGGAGGLGQAMCQRLAAEGARVTVADNDVAKARQIAVSIGATAMAVHLDVTSEASWQTAITAATSAWGNIDIVVNNAGYLKPATIEDATLDDWRTAMAINGDGTFLGCKFAVAAMKERPKTSSAGVIINLSSNMVLRGTAKHPAYSASKAAIRLLTQSVAKHCGEQGYNIRVIALLPGAIETGMLRLNIPKGMSEADYFAQVRGRHPIGRIGQPKDVADAVAFLASEDASFITGSDFIVDGGSSI